MPACRPNRYDSLPLKNRGVVEGKVPSGAPAAPAIWHPKGYVGHLRSTSLPDARTGQPVVSRSSDSEFRTRVLTGARL